MQPQRNIYRKNFSLIVVFMMLISVALVVAVVLAYNLNEKYVENEFASRKIDVEEQTIKPYNEFFQNKIPEITSYQGFLDSASALNYAQSVYQDYSFVKQIKFYVITISSGETADHKNHLRIAVKSVYQYLPHNGTVTGSRSRERGDDRNFELMADKFSNFIASADTSRILDQDEVYRIFYDVRPSKISYLNIPRREEIKTYKQLQENLRPGVVYKQNMMTFFAGCKSP